MTTPDEGAVDVERRRRSLLTALAALSTGPVAGCLSDGDDTTPDPETSPQASPTDSPTPTSTLADGEVVHIAIEGQADVVGFFNNGELSLRTTPEHGTASVDGSELRYDPESGYNGFDRFQYEAEGEEATVRITTYAEASSEAPLVRLPRRSIRPSELGVIVNPHNSYSTAVADYYTEARGIPEENVVELPLPDATGQHAVPMSVLIPKLETMLEALPEGIQGFAVTWVEPFRMQPAEEYWPQDYVPWGIGLTTATAHAELLIERVDFGASYEGENPFIPSDFTYNDAETTRPYDDHGVRPAMMIAMPDVEGAKELIDRGVAADGTMPTGDGYLVGSSDRLYTARLDAFKEASEYWGENGPLDVTHLPVGDRISGKDGVLLYMDGGPRIGGIDTHEYVPGAVADHFTSFGGILSEPWLDGERDSNQMSAMEWLMAGATASFGTTMEPYVTPSRFPDPTVLLDHYYRGNTVLEAYWKSVKRPDLGVFIGEPLARPWGRSTLREVEETLTIETTWLSPEATYTVDVRSAAAGEWSAAVEDISIDNHGPATIEVSDATEFAYRLRRSDQ